MKYCLLQLSAAVLVRLPNGVTKDFPSVQAAQAEAQANFNAANPQQNQQQNPQNPQVPNPQNPQVPTPQNPNRQNPQTKKPPADSPEACFKNELEYLVQLKRIKDDLAITRQVKTAKEMKAKLFKRLSGERRKATKSYSDMTTKCNKKAKEEADAKKKEAKAVAEDEKEAEAGAKKDEKKAGPKKDEKSPKKDDKQTPKTGTAATAADGEKEEILTLPGNFASIVSSILPLLLF